MATTIMSIGFSVDFPAHITFHYYREGIEAPDSTPARRVAKLVFVKTMVLVVTLSLLHGLVFVPAILCALTSLYETFFKGTLCGAQVGVNVMIGSKCDVVAAHI
ncbi:unnamed protein product [Nippostrongylus brasiliensis]|uniref:Aa_trans domain-containing protein n=1 Tax=Nippostrongylus brasiliensis TaxID=27835 RepID=A0A0N4XI38_NIPBR|nr:unnamed protein product [Nippostrongylus brasiliensis]